MFYIDKFTVGSVFREFTGWKTIMSKESSRIFNSNVPIGTKFIDWSPFKEHALLLICKQSLYCVPHSYHKILNYLFLLP